MVFGIERDPQVWFNFKRERNLKNIESTSDQSKFI